MRNQIIAPKLSNAQLEILKMLSRPMDSTELDEFRELLNNNLTRKINEDVDTICKKKGMTEKL